jgi:hypothetical protein
MSTERGKLRLTVDKTHGQYQLSIKDGNGGFRIAGPKFDGTNREVFSAAIDEHTAGTIRQYLDFHFPPKEKE